jgi:PilZ domain
METRQRSRRLHPRSGVAWSAWVTAGANRFRCHTVDVSPSGAKLRPRGEVQPGTVVDVMLQPPDGHRVHTSGIVWRIDSDGMAVLFLKNLPVHITASKTLPEGPRRGWR